MNNTNTKSEVSIETFIPTIIQAFLFVIIVALKYLNEKKLNSFLKNFFDEFGRRNTVFYDEIHKQISEKSPASEKFDTPEITQRNFTASEPYPSPHNLQPIFLDSIGKKLQIGEYIISIENSNTPR